MRYVYSILILFSPLISPVLADGSGTIAGEVRCEQCKIYAGMYVELSGNSGAVEATKQADIGSDGRFELSAVPYGNYKIAVVDQRGVELKRELVIVNNSLTSVLITLNKPKTQKPGTGTVSLAKLKHKPVKAAVKAFNKAVDKTKEGRTDEAIVLLKKAIELDPEYMEAHNNLGARYLVSRQAEKAIPEFRKAIELDPGSASVYANLSLALGHTGDLAGAEQAARRSLSLDPSSRQARYLLGMSLFLQHKLDRETVAILKQSQDISPRAQVALAYAEAAVGETAQARKTVQTYLKSNNDALRPQAEQLLSRLETKPPHP
jgi:Flp pilus assembly protein TadD